MKDCPNIVMFTTDHQRYDCLGINGNPVIQTPTLDRLASEGVNFARMYGQNPVCMPSRASIFTGRYVSNHGVRINGIPLPHSEITLPAALGAAGYHTGQLGKVHFTPHSGRDHEAPHHHYGFDTLVLSDEPGCYPDAYVKWVESRDPAMREKIRVPMPGTRKAFEHWTLEAPEEFSHAAWVATQTIEYIREHKDEPFFAHAGFYNPHPPLNPPKHYVDMYPIEDMPLPMRREGELDDKPRHFQGAYKRFASTTDAQWQEHKAYFYAMVSQVDAQVKRVVACLEELELLDRTLILLMSDHGDMLGDHWHTGKGPTNYDGIIHLPCFMRLPGALPAGKVVEDLVETVDIMPTLLDIAGAPCPERVKGESLMPLIRGERDGWRGEVLVEHKAPDGLSVKTLRTDDYKYTRVHTGEELLVDLRDDPDEFVNRAADPACAGALQEMRERLLACMMRIEDDLERTSVY